MVALPTAREALSKYSVTLTPDTDVLHAIDVLVKKRLAGAPVVNEKGELVGMLTEKDCLRVLSNSTWGEISGGRVGDFMSQPSTVITADMDLLAAAEAFLASNFPVLPVLENGKLLGRVARHDLLQRVHALGRSLERTRERRERKLRRKAPESEELRELEAQRSLKELAAALRRDDRR